MIWLWIIAALVLSYLPLINKKIDLASYMWLLIPIDAYGISVAGAIIKPYMIFALILPVVFYAKNKGNDFDLFASKGQLLAGIITVLILLVNLFNTDDFSSAKAALMAVVVYLCAQCYISSTKMDTIDQLSDVFIASCFGFSIVYLIAYACMINSVPIGDIVAQVRTDNGMFLTSNNMVDGTYTQTFRLRGFAYDPNTMFIQFIFGIAASILKLFKKFSLYYVVTIITSALCIILSGSRMGLLCAALTVIITATIGISKIKSVRKKVATILGVITSCALFLCFTVTKYGQALTSSLLSTYSNRSNLTDEYGRFSIWEECFEIYWNKNPLFGVGFGKMDEYTITERMTHNTWLQFICECGMIVGGIAIIFFLSVLIIGWAKTHSVYTNSPSNTSYMCLIIGYTVTLISLMSVDNITCSYLWFCALLILKIAYYKKPENTATLTN